MNCKVRQAAQYAATRECSASDQTQGAGRQAGLFGIRHAAHYFHGLKRNYLVREDESRQILICLGQHRRNDWRRTKQWHFRLPTYSLIRYRLSLILPNLQVRPSGTFFPWPAEAHVGIRTGALLDVKRPKRLDWNDTKQSFFTRKQAVKPLPLE